MKIRYEEHFGRVFPCFPERPSGVDAMFRQSVVAQPDALAIIDGNQRLSYRELDARVDRLAAGLAALAMRKGDRLATLVGNQLAFIELSLACARLGAIQVPLSTRHRKPEVEHALTQSGASVFVHEAALAAELPDPSSVPGVRHRLAVGGEVGGSLPYEALLSGAVAAADLERVGEDDPFCILYTSGTSGQPKGAVLSNIGVVHSCLNYRQVMELSPSDRMVLAVPAAHVTGLVGLVHSSLCAGACLIIMPQFKARTYLELVERERGTMAILVPAMYNLCLRDPELDRFDLSSWRVGAFGGAPMPEATARLLKEKIPTLTLYNAYGATEATSPVTILPKDAGLHRLDSVGTVLPCVDVKIMDDEGREVTTGESGELWIAGITVTAGYWRNPEADAGSFVGGYWKSGDVGAIDAEGFVRILDRKKDMINRAGFKVFPAEVEGVLAYHASIKEAAVVGYPDPVLGERVEAFIVAQPGVTVDEVRSFCAERLSDYKVPDRVTFVEGNLPRNANGKLQKTLLRANRPDGPAA